MSEENFQFKKSRQPKGRAYFSDGSRRYCDTDFQAIIYIKDQAIRKKIGFKSPIWIFEKVMTNGGCPLPKIDARREGLPAGVFYYYKHFTDIEDEIYHRIHAASTKKQYER